MTVSNARVSASAHSAAVLLPALLTWVFTTEPMGSVKATVTPNKTQPICGAQLSIQVSLVSISSIASIPSSVGFIFYCSHFLAKCSDWCLLAIPAVTGDQALKGTDNMIQSCANTGLGRTSLG